MASPISKIKNEWSYLTFQAERAGDNFSFYFKHTVPGKIETTANHIKEKAATLREKAGKLFSPTAHRHLHTPQTVYSSASDEDSSSFPLDYGAFLAMGSKLRPSYRTKNPSEDKDLEESFSPPNSGSVPFKQQDVVYISSQKPAGSD